MSKQRVRLLVERVLRIKEEPKHNMDKTEGKDLEERVDDLEAEHEEIVEKMDDFESQVTDVETQVSSLDEQAYHLEGGLAMLESEHNDHGGMLNEHESRIGELEPQ